jgi:imidazolonepropionase-like amidohydrolase
MACALSAALTSVANAGAQVVVITGGTVYPVSGPRIEHGTVVIRDGRIVAVGASVPIPVGATTIDATGKWVTPGLINASSQLGIEEIEAVSDTRDFQAKGRDAIAASFAAVDGLNPASQMIPPAREDGVTGAVLVPQGNLVAGQAGVVDLAAAPARDMVLKSPAAMVAQIGNAQSAQLGARGEIVATLRSLFADVKRYAAHRGDYDLARSRPFTVSRANLEALVPVLEGRVPLLVFADRASDISNALALAHDYGIRLIVAGGTEAWKVADALATANVPVLTGALGNIPENFAQLGERQDNAARLRSAGVQVIVIGNSDEEDTTPFSARNIRQDAGTAVAYGLPWNEALRAVTLAPAEAFGVADRVGSLRPGREANVVVWSGDPFEFTTRAEHVFVRGREYHDVSRQDMLTNRYKTLPPAYGTGGAP